MKREKYTSAETLIKSGAGIKYFKIYFPNLQFKSYDDTKCISIDSPFHNERKNSFSIYFSAGRWLFKDHAGQGYKGDVFKFVAYIKRLHIVNDFYKILEIINEVLDSKATSKIEQSIANDTDSSIIYAPTYSCNTLFEKHFGGKIHGDISGTLFNVKLIEKATITDAAGEVVELVSDLIKNEDVYFSFTNNHSGIEVIYNPHQESVFYNCTDGKLPYTSAFGWYEATLHMNFIDPSIAGNLIITNSVENTLLFHSLGYPAIGLIDDNKDATDYLLNVVLMQCSNAMIFFDNTAPLKRAAKKLAGVAKIPIIEFSDEMKEVGFNAIWSYYKNIDDEHIGDYLSQYIKLIEF